MPVASLILAAGGGSGHCYAPKPLLGFKATVSKVKFNVTESARSLTGLHGPKGGGVVTGLAFSPLYYEYQMHYSVTEQGNKICVAVDKMHINFRARPFVFVSKEFPRGSCEFNAVLNHENKHVSTLKKVQRKYAQDFKKYVYDTILQVKPVKISSPGQLAAAQKKIEKQVNARLESYIEEIGYDLAREQTKVDSPSEYERVHNLCENWASRLRLD